MKNTPFQNIMHQDTDIGESRSQWNHKPGESWSKSPLISSTETSDFWQFWDKIWNKTLSNPVSASPTAQVSTTCAESSSRNPGSQPICTTGRSLQASIDWVYGCHLLSWAWVRKKRGCQWCQSEKTKKHKQSWSWVKEQGEPPSTVCFTAESLWKSHDFRNRLSSCQVVLDQHRHDLVARKRPEPLRKPWAGAKLDRHG